MLNQLRGVIPTDFSNKSDPNLKGLSPEQLYKQILTYIIQSQNDREYMANLAGQTALMDYNVGKVMNTLKNTGLDNNTLVIFGSDNSMFLGEHGLNSHSVFTNPSVLYTPVMKVPLVISQPGIIPTNKTSDMMISETDYAPTLLDYAGVKNVTLPNSPGESFAPYLKGEQLPNWKKEVVYEQEESRGISTKDYQYVKRINGTGHPLYINEFYNLTSDPEQNINEYNNPAYSGIIKQLDANLTEFFDKYSDPKYNEWEGGAPKYLAMRENMWKNLWGESWAPISDETQEFDSFGIN